jgi:hypothetical protein
MWMHGLGSALVGGTATAVTVMVVDPMTFNFTQWENVLKAAIVSGVVNAAFYLKQSPLPDYGNNKKSKEKI